MKSLIIAFAICLELTAIAVAWTHGKVVIQGFILDNSSVILTNDDGSQNLLAQ